MGTLWIVATPIGNLEDITLRALRVLREVRLIAAEDTRHTRRLLNHYDIKTPCISYHEHNKLARLDTILSALNEGDVALVSDAGTPTIADPGLELVQACITAGFPVAPVPGPSAVLAALVASGLSTERFACIGFLPRRDVERRQLLEAMADLTLTLVCFETPHRLLEALRDMLEILGDRRMVAANELTKRFETFLRGTVAEMVNHFSLQSPRGEYTLVIEGRRTEGERKRDRYRLRAPAGPTEPPDTADIAHRLRRLRAEGYQGSAAARIVARELGLPKSAVYQVWLSLGEDQT